VSDTAQDTDILWTPPLARAAAAALTALMQRLAAEHGAPADDDAAFHRWTVKHADLFWRAVWDDCGVIGTPGEVVVDDPTRMPGAKWFPKGTLNYAENLLRPRAADQIAVHFRREDGVETIFTYADLCAQVSQCTQALEAAGVTAGDRVAAYMPNCPETLIAMLAAASLGAAFSSASPDFGPRGVLDRFGQIEPKVLIATDGYVYNGKTFDRRGEVKTIAAGLPALTRLIVVPFIASGSVDADVETALWPDALAAHDPKPLTFAPVPFDQPLFILFSSGTTGAPKCIVHGHGGTLLQHLKEQRYHLDIRRDDAVFYFTTCGWMMWNWLVSALALEATLCLFDGSPAYPDTFTLFDYADAANVSFFGTSAKFIDALKSADSDIASRCVLSRLRTVASTGSPLAPESFDYVYRRIKADVHLASIAGGTDIVGCFVTGNPRLPVYRGELQGPALGMDVAIFSPDGRRLTGEPGELVCANAFPSMPVGFWNDTDGARYRAAYFEVFPGVWTHGDWVEQTSHGGFIIHGRSDATLNPGGVRIGTAEIYGAVEGIDGVEEALVIGQDWDNDVRVVLFVKLSAGVKLTGDLIKEIKTRIRSGCSPRHVPVKVLAVTDIPRTRSGKISELAVRDVVHGRPIKNTEALANPDALAQYTDRDELKI
jgi:acetoacetyl-CoA synthetase